MRDEPILISDYSIEYSFVDYGSQNIFKLCSTNSYMEYLNILSFVISNLPGIWKQIKRIYYSGNIFKSIADDSKQLNIFFEVMETGRSALVCTRLDPMDKWKRRYLLCNIPEITSVATARCVSYFLESLALGRPDRNMNFKNIELINSVEYRESDIDSNSVFIGGPNANCALRSIFEQRVFEFFYEFIEQDNEIKIVKKENGKEWPPYGKERKTFDDYGVILKAKNEKGICAFVLAGLGTEATIGAGYYLKHSMAQLSRNFQDEPFGIVIKTSGNYRTVTQVDCSSHYTIKRLKKWHRAIL